MRFISTSSPPATTTIVASVPPPPPAATRKPLTGSRVRVSPVRVSPGETLTLAPEPRFLRWELRRNTRSSRLKAGLTEIEPDLEEDPHDPWRTNGVEPDDFKYGEYDGHHTYFEGNEGGFWEAVVEEYQAAEPPTGFQGLMSWLFLPAIVAGLAYHAPGEYLYIGAAVFVIVFCAIEMAKPDKPHNFEPEIYNMERGARDKLIADYNSMDIWDFNEKYGDLWDFTVKRDDVVKS